MQQEIEVIKNKTELFYVGSSLERTEEILADLCLIFDDFLITDLNTNLENISVSINLCSDDKIISLNNDYRTRNKITDVLSFPVQENLRQGLYDKFLPSLELGDIYICESVCYKQAEEFNIDFRSEFIHLAIHGFLHLCGFDHEINESEEKLMESMEQKLLGRIEKR